MSRFFTHPLRTFGDLAAFDLEATVSCRCGREVTIDGSSGFFRDRPIGIRFRCTTALQFRECGEVHHPTIRRRGRDDWNLEHHWQAMCRRNPGAVEPARCRTYRDLVQAGHIASLVHDCRHPEAYSFAMVAFDEPPWDRFIDRPLHSIACPICRKALSMRYTCGGHGEGGNRTRAAEHIAPPAPRPRSGRFEHTVITGPA